MYFTIILFLFYRFASSQSPYLSIDASPQRCECACDCGYVAANSTTVKTSCPKVGDSFPIAQRIVWSDGSYSDASFNIVTQTVLGSCCSHISVVQYGNGGITGGKYAGQPANLVTNFRDTKPECLSCPTKSRLGVSGLSGPIFLEIGTAGQQNRKRCKGTIQLFYSPPVTSAVQVVTFTYEVKYTECTNCTDKC